MLQYEYFTNKVFRMLIGYIRVSTDDQNLNLQKDALLKYGIDERNIFEDKTSGSKNKRVGLDKAIEFLKEGDTLVVWKLDRLGRSLSHLINVITFLKSRNISFISITEAVVVSIPSVIDINDIFLFFKEVITVIR